MPKKNHAKYLEGFPNYQVDIHPMIFILSGLTLILISWITLSYFAVKANQNLIRLLSVSSNYQSRHGMACIWHTGFTFRLLENKFTPSHQLLEQRIRISNRQELMLMMVSNFQCKMVSL